MLDLQGALYGMSAQIYFDHGAQGIDLESWVSEHLHDAVTLNLGFDWTAAGLDQPVTYGYGGTGTDFIFGSVNNDTLKGHGGNDKLQGGAGDDLIMGGLGDDVLIGQEGVDSLQGGSGNDVLSGMDGDDTLQGGEDNDELQGNLGNDTLEGDAGDDNLFGQEGSDVLNGGTGDDTLSGNAGDDIYMFNLGGGQDVIWEEGDSIGDLGDVLRFGEGIVPVDISVVKSGYDLVLFHVNGLDQITISNWYIDPFWQLARFEFTDGTVWNANDASNRGLVNLRGTASNDAIYGSALNETLFGLGGNDYLYGSGGDDTLIGGKGNDNLYGESGYNTYLFALGDGADTISPYSSYADTLRFSADISSTDIIVERMGIDLLLHHQNGVDSVRIIGWYASYTQLKQIVFDADGTIWSNSTLYQMGISRGNTYTLNLGDGAKIIQDWGGMDSLTFGADIGEADITVSRVGQDLHLAHVNGVDSVTIKDWFNDLSKQIETIQFSTTGIVLTTAQLTTSFLTLTGTVGNDVIQGGNAYDEELIGLGGNDALNGGEGVDTYIFNQGDGQDTITDTSYFGGNALVFGPGLLGLLNVSTNSSNDTVYSFGADSVKVKAGSYITTLKFVSNGTSVADTLNGSAYGDIMHALEGNDVINGNAGADALYGDAGNDTIAGGDDSDWLYGGDGDDVLDGSVLTGSSDGQTYGSDSTDYYVGGKGNDTLQGNSRDDYYYFNLGDGNDVVAEGSYYLNGQWFYSYFDQLIFGSGITPNNIQATKLNNDLVVTVSTIDTVTIKDWFSNVRYQVDSFKFDDGSYLSAMDMTRMANTVHGTAGDDVLTGNAASDTVLYGEAGNDTLNGGDGNDALHGGAGNDTLNGGSGNDEYIFERNGGQDVIYDTGGTDTVRFDASISAPDFSLSRSGNNLVLALTGTNDRLIVKDFMNGNLSLWTAAGDNVVNYTNYAIIESFVFADGSSLPSTQSLWDSFLDFRGSGSDDELTGTAWADVIYGSDGNDVLYGSGDDDVLYGGTGNDTLDGGSGDINLLYGQDGDDVLIGEGGVGFGSDSYLHGGYGNDTYRFAPQASFNILEAGGNDDKIEFYEGISLTDLNFQQWSNDLTISVASGGSVDIYGQFMNDASKVERLLLADGIVLGLRDIQFGTGTALTGTAEDSILIGYSTNDTLNGGEGNDWLDGGAGSDTMAGGMGDDLYFVDNMKDAVTELDNQGTDTVSSSVTYTLESNVEYLVLTGAAKIKGTGNALDNVLSGNSAANTLAGDAGNDLLNGKGGDDKMLGGIGNDTFVVDDYGDIVIERSNEGTDQVLSSVTYTLSKHVENLTLTGTTAISGTGNALDNTLIGNSAANILTGGKGNDAYILGRGYGTDTVIENDSTTGNIDIAQFLSGISTDQIWFQHVGNNLEVSVIGSADKLVIKDWYLGSAYHVERFKTADGMTLLDSQVENLVIAMAVFALPEAGQTTLPPAYESSLNPVITAFWL